MSEIILPPNSKKYHVDVPTQNGPKRISTRTSDPKAAKVIGATLEHFAAKNKGKKVTKVTVMDAAKMLAKTVNTGQFEHSPIDIVLPKLAEQTGVSDHDKGMKELIVDRFLEFMKDKQLDKMDIWDLADAAADVSEFMTHAAAKYHWGQRSKRTYGQSLGVVFQAAVDFKLMPENPMRSITLPPRPQRSPRRPFTDEELIKTFFAGDDEWKEMIVTGSATGMRIGDVALTVVSDIDFETGFVRPLVRKVNQFEPKPLPPWLLERWRPTYEGLPAETPLFKRAYNWMYMKEKGSDKVNVTSSRVSAEFVELLYRAGVRKPGKVRGVERVGANKFLPLSFACLRNTYTTLLKISCATEAEARHLVGHKSQIVSDTYTAFDEETAKNTVARLHNPFAKLLAKPADEQIYLFDTGHLPIASWVMRFPKSKTWDGAVPAQLAHCRTTREPKILGIKAALLSKTENCEGDRAVAAETES